MLYKHFTSSYRLFYNRFPANSATVRVVRYRFFYSATSITNHSIWGLSIVRSNALWQTGITSFSLPRSNPREAAGYCRGMPGCKMPTVVNSWICALTAIGIFQILLCIVRGVWLCLFTNIFTLQIERISKNMQLQIVAKYSYLPKWQNSVWSHLPPVLRKIHFRTLLQLVNGFCQLQVRSQHVSILFKFDPICLGTDMILRHDGEQHLCFLLGFTPVDREWRSAANFPLRQT